MIRTPNKCLVCGEPVKPGSRGPLPEVHPACAGRSYDGKRKQIDLGFGETEGPETPRARSKAERIELAIQASAVELMAIGLSVNSNPVQAALASGLELSEPEAIALAERARAECPDLIEGKTTAIGKLVRQALLYLVINLRNSAHSLPPSQVAPSIKGLTQALELITGGMAPAYGNISLVINAPDGSSVNLSEILGDIPSASVN